MGLRSDVYADLSEALARYGFFADYDFRIDVETTHRGSHIKITYRYAEQFQLSALIPNSRVEVSKNERASWAFLIKCVASPGEITQEQDILVHDRAGLIDAVVSWTRWLRKELESNPVVRHMFDERLAMDEALKYLEERFASDDDDSHLTPKEAEAFSGELKKLEAKLEEHVRRRRSISSSSKESSRNSIRCSFSLKARSGRSRRRTQLGLFRQESGIGHATPRTRD